ncbi:MAG: hypothetical protein CM15mP58_05840 [Burkholderiaceae bacterium]|nr:MAG: hypothetical protein CM15mP58_05840 [Burkholderiaceae bacterium]
MSSVGALEMLTPMVQPAEYWKESGRFEVMGEELMRIEDRHGRPLYYNQLRKRYSLKQQNMN